MDTSKGTCEPLADGHCHLQDGRFDPERVHTILEINKSASIVVNGCSPDDWHRVIDLWRAFPDVILPQLGLHPWWVSKQVDGRPWLDELRKLLEEYPMAGLGECGLDTSGRWADSFQMQKEAFEGQIQLAIDLGRPLSVHCVKAYGHVLDHLSTIHERVPVLLHGWGGSAEMTKTFARQLKNVYFSINLGLTRLDPIRAVRMLNEIPKDRFVLESDGPDGVLVQQNWEVWLSSLPQLQPVANALGDRILQAYTLGEPENIILVAHIVATLTNQCPKTLMALNKTNITLIFRFGC